MTIPEKSVQWAIQTANDNTHGYSQADRWGPDYDCSSFVITAYEQAGLKLREAGASYTGNMVGPLLACGFFDATKLVNLGSGGGVQAGDILFCSAHTCLSIGSGRVANCRTDEGHPQAGDQSGAEIRIQNYWNYPWSNVYRYSGTINQNNDTATATLPVAENHDWTPPTLKASNSYFAAVAVLQGLLNCHNFDSGKIDGYFGPKTTAAVNRARKFYALPDATGICDADLWKKTGGDVMWSVEKNNFSMVEGD